MSEKIVQLNEEVIKGQLKELVRGSVEETLNELLSVLSRCTDIQQRRFLLYALDGLSYAEIAARCGCSKSSVQSSIEAVRKIFEKQTIRLTPFRATQ